MDSRSMTIRRWASLLSSLGVLSVWELSSRVAAPHALIPAPTAILSQLWTDRADYVGHALATLQAAGLGYVIGNGIAVALAVAFLFVPQMRILMGLLTLIFSIPLILLIPIIGMAFRPEICAIVSASLLVYYPTLLATSAALLSAEASLVNVVRAAGGGNLAIFRRVRVRSAIPGLSAGLRTAAPFAILGAMLGELTGARWGLGTYLLATMARANPTKEWAIFVICTGLAVLVYFAVGVALKPLGIPSPTGAYPNGGQAGTTRVQSWKKSVARNFSMVFFTLFLWQIGVMILNLPYFAKGPIDLMRMVTTLPADVWSELSFGFAQTLMSAGEGLVVGLGTAFFLAVVLDVVPALAPPALPFVIISQTVPIVALIPLFVAILGRGLLTTLAVTTSATFFASFIIIVQGLQRTPTNLINVLNSGGASRFTVLWRAKLPSAVPFVFAAARVNAPRVLLGVTLAEYLATRRGLGALIFEARGRLDFGMMWLIAAGTGAVSIIFYQAVRHLELRFAHKYGAADGTTSI